MTDWSFRNGFFKTEVKSQQKHHWCRKVGSGQFLINNDKDTNILFPQCFVSLSSISNFINTRRPWLPNSISHHFHLGLFFSSWVLATRGVLVGAILFPFVTWAIIYMPVYLSSVRLWILYIFDKYPYYACDVLDHSLPLLSAGQYHLCGIIQIWYASMKC